MGLRRFGGCFPAFIYPDAGGFQMSDFHVTPYASAPFTLPAVTSLLTGTYPEEVGVWSNESKLPESVPTLATELRVHLGPDKLIVSIAAGLRIAALSGLFGNDLRLVRVMPNTPCLVGQGACGFCLSEQATDADAELVERLLTAVGIAFRVEERLLDAVTGLSGSGPAYVYMMIEALSDGGVRMGLPRNVATALAAQTVRGAAQMVLATGEHTGALKDKVASPGGTTIAGIQALEAAGLRAALMSAVEAATRRSIELATDSAK